MYYGLISRALIMSIVAVSISAVILNLTLAWMAENVFPDMEMMTGVMGEVVSMLKMHNQAQLSSSIIMAVVAALSCITVAPFIMPYIKKTAKQIGV